MLVLCRAVLCRGGQVEAAGEQVALLEAEITPLRRALGEAGEHQLHAGFVAESQRSTATLQCEAVLIYSRQCSSSSKPKPALLPVPSPCCLCSRGDAFWQANKGYLLAFLMPNDTSTQTVTVIVVSACFLMCYVVC